ncbi:hypothetical protein [Variovorax sp.]|uniref:hypothetical protein n=1 Tax=Variovorax sp. TaxID=1871043 RepID=UPI003BAB28A2
MPYKLKEAAEIQAEVERLVRMHPEFVEDDPLYAVGLPIALRPPIIGGANWTMHLPGTAYETPAVIAAITDVGARWNLRSGHHAAP